jgi:hypothetical protein
MNHLSQHFREVNSPVWNIDQERLLMETLINQRLNFLLVFFAFVVAGAINAKSKLILLIILSLGIIICSMLSYIIYRAYIRWDIIMKKILKDPNHPAKIVDRIAKINGFLKGLSARPIIGLILPIILSSILFISFMLVAIGCYNPSDSVNKTEMLHKMHHNVEGYHFSHHPSIVPHYKNK